jgi:hypothetical protein
LIDLTLRSVNVDLNFSSLEHGIEHEIGSIFESVFEPDQDFVLTAMFIGQPENDQNNSEVIISNIRSPPQLNENTKPKFEKNLELYNLGPEKKENEEIVIKLYLI